MSKTKQKQQKNSRKNNTKNNQPRGVYRKAPICYMLSSCQLLNYIEWPTIFKQYANRYTDIWAKTMYFIFELSKTQYPPIEENIGFKLANKVVTFVNTNRNSKDAELWKIDKQQDAFEYLGYFFSMIVDLTKRKQIPKVLNVQPICTQKMQIIKNMQSWIIKMFVFKTAKYIKCQTLQYENQPEQHFVLKLHLPKSNKPVTLQQLVDDHFIIQEIKKVKCRICKKIHDSTSVYKCKELNNKYILFNLLRFHTVYDREADYYSETKKTNDISVDLPIVFKVEDKYQVYETVAGINHVNGFNTKSGHYNTDKYFNGKIHNCDHHKIKPNVPEFNYKGIYIGLVKRVDNQKKKKI